METADTEADSDPTDTEADSTPVVLATDIGTDVDDTWALAQLLRTPGLDLRFVLTETGEPAYRGSIAAKLLERADRTDVPVGLGVDFGTMDDEERNQWIDALIEQGYSEEGAKEVLEFAGAEVAKSEMEE